MAEEMQWQPGTFCWTELMTRDVEAAKKFYKELIGWKMTDQAVAGTPYTTFAPEGAERSVGGMMQMSGPQFEGLPPHWMPYIAVKDIDDCAKRCTALGGSIRVPPTDIPNVGRFCVIADPTGAVISLFQI
ncbi:MAG: VOC family protein [Phycisphaerae bacterium]|jgi:predicted enzyme related to lactoylglutathione lyase